MLKTFRTIAILAAVLALALWSSDVSIAKTVEPGPVRDKGKARTAAAGKVRSLLVHDVGNVRMTLSNWGEQGNPDLTPGYFGFEYPLGAETDFLYSAGIWVGADRSGVKLVSTGTDGDNGTNEFAPSFNGYVATSKQYSEMSGRPFIKGAKAIDDDGDWNPDTDDLEGNGKPSFDWDGGGGYINRDDDGDGFIDEETADGLDDDGDGLIDEDTWNGDDNGDSNCRYDPEPHMDEDPAGDMSNDFIDNDFDGLVDGDDPDYDGDMVPGSNDDDGDGLMDEDGVARGTQEYFCVYDDVELSEVSNPDADGHTPLGLQVLQRTYAWGEAYAGDFILVDLIVRNISPVPLTDVYLALFADPDVAAKGESGDPASLDDWNFYDASNLMMIQGDDTTDADGFGPGLFAMKVVRTPAPLDSLNIAFWNFERVSGGDPETNAAKFDMISAENHISPPTDALGDWRFLMGIGPLGGGWLLLPGAELKVTVAYLAGDNIADIQKNAQWAQAIYDNDFQGPAAPDQPEFWVEEYPDHMRIFWNDNAETSIDPITGDMDFEGYVIQRSPDTNTWNTLEQYDYINVLPSEEFQRENINLGMPYDINPIPGTNWDWVLDSSYVPASDGSDSLIVDSSRIYWYDDETVLRGFTYHYIVRAFDQGVEGAGVLITPIGTSFITATAGYTPETSEIGNSVQGVFVVPNPYRGSHEMETDGALDDDGQKIYPRKLYFMNLPTSGATINIYTLAGDHVITHIHKPGRDITQWDMRNKYNQEIVSGIYYYVVKADDGGDVKIDKFVVLK